MAAIERHPVVTQITQELEAHLADWFGEGTTLTTPLPVIQSRKWSYLMRYGVRMPAGLDTALLVKIPREPGILTLDGAIKAEQWYAATRLEYDTLQAIATTFTEVSTEIFCTIRPLVYLPQWNAIVMEEMPAQPLKSALLKGRMIVGMAEDWHQFETALNRAGCWLRIFHEKLGNLTYQPFNAVDVRAEIERDLNHLEAVTARKVDTKTLRVAFERSLIALQKASVPVAALHGDFNCANILLSPDGRVSALDMNNNLRGSVYQDLATLITDLFTRKQAFMAYGLFVRNHRLERGADAVLEGYFGAEPYNQELLNVACALAITRKWIRDEEALAQSSAAVRLLNLPVRFGIRRYFWHLISRYLSNNVFTPPEPKVALTVKRRV
jgi:hypothetical protein